jgi:hypothetical protein
LEGVPDPGERVAGNVAELAALSAAAYGPHGYNKKVGAG